MQVPQQLVEQIIKGQCTLFVGSEISIGTSVQDGAPRLSDLALTLASACGYSEPDCTLSKVSQYYAMVKGHSELITFIRQSFVDIDHSPLPAHQAITRLPFRVIITTNYDELLEKALHQASKPYRQVVRNEEVAYLAPDEVTLIKLHGTISQPHSLVITMDDYLDFLDKLSSISTFVKAEFATKTLLFVGYSLDDPDFQRLYVEATRTLDRYKRPAFAVQCEPSAYAIKWWRTRGVEITPSDATEFLEALEIAIKNWPVSGIRIENQLSCEPVTTIPKRPYKALNYYEVEDASIFFGRQDEIRQLISYIEAYRSVILYGVSGTGKTSLLNAGVTPELNYRGYLPVSVRSFDDPALAIKRAINQRLSTPVAGSESTGLHDFLERATTALDKTIVIFLDQFEEFFVRLSPQIQKEFIAELAVAYNDPRLPVKFLFSLRKDYLAEMGEFEGKFPAIFRNRMGIKRLTRLNAEQAIVEPARTFDFEYEQALVNVLLDALYDNGIYPPHLQIVCNTLYDHLAEGSWCITLDMYKELGGAQKILGGYLDEVLLEFPNQLVILARSTLIELVTSRETKGVLVESALRQRMNGTNEDKTTVLNRLVNTRLVRCDEQDGIMYYELAHEYLVEEIYSWIDEQQREFKKAREVLEQELDSAFRFGTHVDRERIDLLAKHWNRLAASPDAEVLLLYSAVKENQQIARWLKMIGDPENKATALLKASSDKDENIRIRAAQALATVSSNRTSESLINSALSDPSAAVREASAMSFAELMGLSAISQLSQLVKDRQNKAYRQAVEALAYILDANDYNVPVSWLVKLQLSRQLVIIRLRKHRLQIATDIKGAALGGALGGLLLLAIYSYIGTSPNWSGAVLAGLFVGIPMGLFLGGFVAAGMCFHLLSNRKHRFVSSTVGAILGGSLASLVVYSFVFLLDAKGAPVLFRSIFVFGVTFGGVWALFITSLRQIMANTIWFIRVGIVTITGLISGLAASLLLEIIIWFQGWQPEERAFPNFGVTAVGLMLLGAAIALGFVIAQNRTRQSN